MKPVTLDEIAQATDGEIVQGSPLAQYCSVSIDSRNIREGELFFALSGERYDAHNFLSQAAAAGAGGLVVSRRADLPLDIPVLLVNNTLTALQTLASYNRKKCRVPLIGITGSTGKTSTKDIAASVLTTRYNTLKTPGNLNNEIGLPLTLLAMDDKCEAAVVEMAMRGAGEIDALCRMARPNGAIITNIGETHLELLGTVSGIASAKGEILEHIPPDGFALLNAESPFIQREAARCRGRVTFFGMEQPAEIMAEDIKPDGGGSRFKAIIKGAAHEFFLSVPGRHNVMNALAAIGAGVEMGLTIEEIARGLAGVTLTGMRLEILDAQGIKIINDAYNANPASTKAALQVLKETAGTNRMVAVLGNMLELGPRTADGHREVGQTAAKLGVSYLVAVGDLAAGIAAGALSEGMEPEKVFSFDSNEKAAEILKELLREGDVVLVKGSRGMKMEQIVQHLLKCRPVSGS